ncbi:MAG TPA: hypothetical protein VL337_09065 [Acidimicrobiales bacterium]|nr:hypothetical protein [Acidimicrobiales bacterium]
MKIAGAPIAVPSPSVSTMSRPAKVRSSPWAQSTGRKGFRNRPATEGDAYSVPAPVALAHA